MVCGQCIPGGVQLIAGSRDIDLQLCGISPVKAVKNQSDTERDQAAEIARLKRKLAEQEEELAIVKKAAAYFAKSLK